VGVCMPSDRCVVFGTKIWVSVRRGGMRDNVSQTPQTGSANAQSKRRGLLGCQK
jgi:hypothetical protein